MRLHNGLYWFKYIKQKGICFFLKCRLKESSVTSSSSSSSRLRTDHVPRRSIDEGAPLSSEDLGKKTPTTKFKFCNYDFYLFKNIVNNLKIIVNNIIKNLKLFDYIKKKSTKNYVHSNKKKLIINLKEKEIKCKFLLSLKKEKRRLFFFLSISSPHSSVKPILVHHDPKDLSSPSGHHYHHVHVEDNHDDDNDHSLTPEERGLN